jgi:hypothetical protein
MTKPIKTEVESLETSQNLVRFALALGIAASLAANVLHADTDVISRIIAAWPPTALIVTVEIITRISAKSGWMSVVRIIATSVVAAIAAWVSYWHTAGVASRYGETYISAHMIPFSVDGLIVVASISLVEVNRRLGVLLASESTVKAPEVDADALNDAPQVITPVELETPRQRVSHRAGNHQHCDHDNTRAARAACRRTRAEALSPA